MCTMICGVAHARALEETAQLCDPALSVVLSLARCVDAMSFDLTLWPCDHLALLVLTKLLSHTSTHRSGGPASFSQRGGFSHVLATPFLYVLVVDRRAHFHTPQRSALTQYGTEVAKSSPMPLLNTPTSTHRSDAPSHDETEVDAAFRELELVCRSINLEHPVPELEHPVLSVVKAAWPALEVGASALYFMCTHEQVVRTGGECHLQECE